MPCRSDYLESNERERELQNTAKLLVFVKKKLNQSITKKLQKAANDPYCKDDYVPELCSILRNFSTEQENEIIYDGRDATSRKLADWWDRHKKADQKRVELEELRKQALSKLTKEEIKALGIKAK